MKTKNDNLRHYQGLLADWYDDLLAGETKDAGFYHSLLGAEDAPVLDMACGTGRLLIGFLQKNIETHGLDLSAEMLSVCRKKLEKACLKTSLFNQDMIKMELPGKYKTILVSGGSFQLIDNSGEALLALQNIHEHLVDGGKFICDLWIPWDEIIENAQNVWKSGRVACRDDGSKLVVSYFKQFDLKNQVQSGEFKYELFKNSFLTETQILNIKLKWYSVNEFVLMLEKAGFSDIRTEEKRIVSSHGVSTVYTAFK